MPLKDELEEAVSKIVREIWVERDGEVVPEPENLKLGNDAVNLDATVLYADMAASTQLVDSHIAWRAAEVYKAYMFCAAQLIKFHGGSITAYDGDRVMGVFIGDSKNSSAAKAALRINWALSISLIRQTSGCTEIVPTVSPTSSGLTRVESSHAESASETTMTSYGWVRPQTTQLN